MIIEFTSLAHEASDTRERARIICELAHAWGVESYNATRYAQHTPERHRAERHAAIAAHAYALALAELSPKAYDTKGRDA